MMKRILLSCGTTRMSLCRTITSFPFTSFSKQPRQMLISTRLRCDSSHTKLTQEELNRIVYQPRNEHELKDLISLITNQDDSIPGIPPFLFIERF